MLRPSHDEASGQPSGGGNCSRETTLELSEQAVSRDCMCSCRTVDPDAALRDIRVRFCDADATSPTSSNKVFGLELMPTVFFEYRRWAR